jgi:hypothetical protein
VEGFFGQGYFSQGYYGQGYFGDEEDMPDATGEATETVLPVLQMSGQGTVTYEHEEVEPPYYRNRILQSRLFGWGSRPSS